MRQSARRLRTVLVKCEIGRGLRVEQQRRAANSRHDLLEHFNPLAAQRRLDVDEPRNVAAGPETFDKSAANGIGNDDEHDRNRFGLAL